MIRSKLPFLLGLMVLLAACGQGADPEVTITSTPPATVFLDGAEIGTTPITRTLAPGSHTLAFEAEGFDREESTVEVEAGTDARIETFLKISDPGDPMALARLAEALDESIAPPDDDIVAHRGGTRNGIILYWPKEDIRKAGLSSYRIDVDEDYEGDGYVEFRLGGRVVHREEFAPNHTVTVERIPDAILEAVDVGDSVTWGVVWDDDARKRPVTATFKVVRDSKVGRRLERLTGSRFFQKQERITQEMLKADVLRDSGLHSEAITQYLAIARAWPSSTLPYRGLVTSARNLGLKDTALYAMGSRFAVGRSRISDRPSIADGSLGRRPSKLPPSLAGPSIEDLGGTPIPGSEGGGSDTATAPGDPTAVAGAGSSGSVVAVARQTAGVLVNAAEKDAAKARAAEDRARRLDESARKVAEAEGRVMAAEKERHQARGELDPARERVHRAMAELEDAKASEDPEAVAAAEKAFERAMKELMRVEERAAEAQDDLNRAQDRLAKTREEAGGLAAKDAEEAAEAARREAEDLRAGAEGAKASAAALGGPDGAAAPGDPGPGAPDGLRAAADVLRDQAAALADRAERMRLTADEAEQAEQDRRRAEREADRADDAVEQARERVKKLTEIIENQKESGLVDEAIDAIGPALDDLEKAERAADAAREQAQEARDTESRLKKEFPGIPPDELRDEADELADEAAEAAKAAEAAHEAAEKEERGEK